MKLTKPLLMLSTLALTTASTTALADQSTEQVMSGNHQLPARYYNYGSQWAEDNQVMTSKMIILIATAILCIAPMVTGTIVDLTRKADLKSVFFLSNPSKF